MKNAMHQPRTHLASVPGAHVSRFMERPPPPVPAKWKPAPKTRGALNYLRALNRARDQIEVLEQDLHEAQTQLRITTAGLRKAQEDARASDAAAKEAMNRASILEGRCARLSALLELGDEDDGGMSTVDALAEAVAAKLKGD